MSDRNGDVSREEILQFTPHRDPMLFLDRGEEYVPFNRMVGIKTIAVDEPFFQGSQPHDGCFPNTLILEAMGQVGGVLMSKSFGADLSGKFVAFITMDNVRFLRRARLGDVLRMPVSITKFRDNFFRFHAEAYVSDRLTAECDFSGIAVDAPVKA
ncbi:3-hydroxyacyl-[acyl-carrier-protein] dehydratase FabZ (plasmid) [Asticcacaulis sp. MM231]|uniref:3-hydroxyacyl-ACP dehydratase FabZ family protein n=1 Tax=Asticcacaulis sp. MM231 TaxID=3157666 RepID=UPI0032D57631